MSKNINKNVVTKEGYENFIKELEYLKSTGREEAANAIRTASEQGDLSENAEYDAAKEAQAHLERRIFELEDFLNNCEIVETQNDGTITIGKVITLIRCDDNTEYKIKLVGNNEAEPFSMKISVASPVGKSILGKQIGDIINVDAPSGNIEFKISDITLN